MKETVEFSQKIYDLLDERGQIWVKYDSVNRDVAQFRKLAPANQGAAQPLDSLTPDNLPPEEISAALMELRKKLREIESSKQKIKNYQQKIEEIKHRATMIYIGIGVVIVFVIFLIIYFIT